MLSFRKNIFTQIEYLLIGLMLMWSSINCCGDESGSIPDDFPSFISPGHEAEMNTLRKLYWLHYPGSGPKATLWDEWLLSPSIWPAVESGNRMTEFREQWENVLSSRIIDKDGYVATHQHGSIAHQLGWPFPFWLQGGGGNFGWHFSFKNTVDAGWRPNNLSDSKNWMLEGAVDKGINDEGWAIKSTEKNAAIITPSNSYIVDSYQAPFIQIRWRGRNLGNAHPYIEWASKSNPSFNEDRRMYFDAPSSGGIVYTMIPMFKHPKWNGSDITQFRICLGNTQKDSDIVLQALFGQYDTRHNVNSQSFVTGCVNYFRWTGDLDFLRKNINRMRIAVNFVMTEHQSMKRKVVFTDWVGHEGRSGVVWDKNHKDKKILYGNGVGNNYWDLLPFGYKDCYATIRFYGMLQSFAKLEAEINSHPEWNIPDGVCKFSSDFLFKHAQEIKKEGNKEFWNSKTGRFVAAVNIDGNKPDYGFTFLNLEAIYYDFADTGHAKKILEWLDGRRIVEGDTSQGADIYHWRFAPRATTKRNIDYYFWGWSSPESLKFGDQVQDGGAVLGFSHHDLMSRLKVSGADDAWKRLSEIVKWFDEVDAAGGYRKYYDGKREGSLQGGGTPGGLGLDNEFFESVMVPQIMLEGFLGFAPKGDGFSIKPNLPSALSKLMISRIHYKNLILAVAVSEDAIEIIKTSGFSNDTDIIYIPDGNWEITYFKNDNSKDEKVNRFVSNEEPHIHLNLDAYSKILMKKLQDK